MASGRPDWYSSVAMHGKYIDVGDVDHYVTVAVDEDGNMLGIMQGEGPAGLDTIALDAAGNMKANLVLQDLSRLTIRTSLGTPVAANLSHAFLGAGNFDILEIEGRGVILGGVIIHNVGVSHKACRMTLYIDDVDFGSIQFGDLRAINAVKEFEYPFRLMHYDDEADFYYAAAFNPGWTFDTKLKLNFSEQVGASQWDGYLYYALVT